MRIVSGGERSSGIAGSTKAAGAAQRPLCLGLVLKPDADNE